MPEHFHDTDGANATPTTDDAKDALAYFGWSHERIDRWYDSEIAAARSAGSTTGNSSRQDELTRHLLDMADSLDDHVTHQDVYRLLMEAVTLSRQRDAVLTAVLEKADSIEAEGKGGSTELIARSIAAEFRNAITSAQGGDNRG